MTSKEYFQVGMPDEYRKIISEIQEKKPELKSSSKVVEHALQLLHLQMKDEIDYKSFIGLVEK